jgi:hypothetical protein
LNTHLLSFSIFDSQTAIGLFGGKKVKKSTETPKANPKKKDMTWGGRPDPTPETYIDEKEDFWSKAWRVGKKKSKK